MVISLCIFRLEAETAKITIGQMADNLILKGTNIRYSKYHVENLILRHDFSLRPMVYDKFVMLFVKCKLNGLVQQRMACISIVAS